MRHHAPQKLLQSQPPNQFTRQPRPAELPTVLHTHRRRIDLHPSPLSFLKQRLLSSIVAIPFGRVPHAQPPFFVETPQPRDHTLPRPTLGAIRFDQRPIRPPLPVLLPKALPNEHGGMLRQQLPPPRLKVVTTQRPEAHPAAVSPSTNNLRSKLVAINFQNRDFVIELGKLG